MGFDLRVQAQVGACELDVQLRGNSRPVALIGPNGAGKTSLFRLITGALTPSTGCMRLGDTLVYDGQQGIDLPPEVRRVGYVPQGSGLFPHLRVLDNVTFGLRVGEAATRPKEARRRGQELLETLGCGHLGRRLPGQLSGGEQQRVALARALAVRPRLLLLDEPFSAMDATVRRMLRRLLAERLRAEQLPAIIISHDVRDVRALDAEVCVMAQGKVAQFGDLQTLQQAPANAFVAEFCGVDPDV